jgi:hypothetical protein
MSVSALYPTIFSSPSPRNGKTPPRGEALPSLAGSQGLRDRFYAWRGKSGRRYVCSVFRDGEESFIADVTDGAIIGVARADAVSRPVCVIDARRSPGTQALRALGRELGVVEWHVHFSGDADGVVSDLSGSLLH